MNKKNGKINTIKRLLKYVTSTYKLQLVIVLISIIVSALVGVAGIQFLKYLIDDFIIPLVNSQNPDFGPLLQVILIMGGIYLVGVLGTYIYIID